MIKKAVLPESNLPDKVPFDLLRPIDLAALLPQNVIYLGLNVFGEFLAGERQDDCPAVTADVDEGLASQPVPQPTF